MSQKSRAVFVTGGTGYIGEALIPSLLSRGHSVRALTRPASSQRLPVGVTPVVGDALDPESVAASVRPDETLVHLVGTPHPNPRKAHEFLRVDLASALASIGAVQRMQLPHLVYVSVAPPAPMMHAYISARAKAEQAIGAANLTATVLRPWYVLGPGHRWPYLLVPVYTFASMLPNLRDGAHRLGLVTRRQMVSAIVRAVEDPPEQGTIRVLDVRAIRESGKS